MSNCDIFHRNRRFTREADQLRAGLPVNMSRHFTNKTNQLCANLPFNIHQILGMARQQQQQGRGAEVMSLSTVPGLVNQSANWSHHYQNGTLGVNLSENLARSHNITNSTESFRCADTSVRRLATTMYASEDQDNDDLLGEWQYKSRWKVLNIKNVCKSCLY